jgi:hypothetical protein
MDVMTLDVVTQQPEEREVPRIQANREELVERIARTIREDGTVQPLQGLHLYRHSTPLEPIHSVVEPSLCVVVQGSKEFLAGESRYRYDPLQKWARKPPSFKWGMNGPSRLAFSVAK